MKTEKAAMRHAGDVEKTAEPLDRAEGEEKEPTDPQAEPTVCVMQESAVFAGGRISARKGDYVRITRKLAEAYQATGAVRLAEPGYGGFVYDVVTADLALAEARDRANADREKRLADARAQANAMRLMRGG